MAGNRTLGYGLVGIGAIIFIFGLLWGIGNLSSGAIEFTGLLFLLFFLALVAGALVVGGMVVLRRTAEEGVELADVKRQRTILSAIQAQGKISIAEAALTTQSDAETVRKDIYDLVGKGIFSGYIDWNGGMLYSKQAREIRAGGVCPNCGAQIELAGKGVIKCQYCGTEVFL
jgi:DNA-directed RNA polymerase subunit RPC12/RpoP